MQEKLENSIFMLYSILILCCLIWSNFQDDEGDEGEDSDEDNVISFSSSAFPHYTQYDL